MHGRGTVHSGVARAVGEADAGGGAVVHFAVGRLHDGTCTHELGVAGKVVMLGATARIGVHCARVLVTQAGVHQGLRRLRRCHSERVLGKTAAVRGSCGSC